MEATASTLSLSEIRIDGGTQVRAEINMITVSEYAVDMRAGAVFPPVVVFHDGKHNWLADGFHRYHAASEAEHESIDCDIRNGTKRDAVLFAVGANAHHGQRRTNNDKLRAVQLLLADKDWAKKSNRWIADKCGVSDPYVMRIRKDSELLTVSSSSESQTRIGQDGKERRLPERDEVEAGDESPVVESQTEFESEPTAAPTPIEPDEPKAFDEGRAREKLFDVVHSVGDLYPKEFRHRLVHWLRTIAKEYEKEIQ